MNQVNNKIGRKISQHWYTGKVIGIQDKDKVWRNQYYLNGIRKDVVDVKMVVESKIIVVNSNGSDNNKSTIPAILIAIVVVMQIKSYYKYT